MIRANSGRVKRRFVSTCLGVGAVALVVTAAGSAHAYERQHHAGLGPELAILKVDDKSTLSVGAGLRAHYTYGLTDSFNLIAEGASAIVATDQAQDTLKTPHTRPAGVHGAAVGVAYVIDILQFVPYVGALAEGTFLTAGSLDKSHFVGGASVVLGLDWQLNRSFTVGLAGRQHFLLSNMSTYPS